MLGRIGHNLGPTINPWMTAYTKPNIVKADFECVA